MTHAMRLVLICLSIGLAACSKHWREIGHPISQSEMQSILNEVSAPGVKAQDSSLLTEALKVKDDVNASLYYADTEGGFGQITNVLGFFNYEFLGYGSDFGYKNITAARVLFFDAPQTDGSRKTSLILGIKTDKNDFQYHAFVGNRAGIGAGQYQADLNGANNQLALIVKSFDASSEGLEEVIQLKFYNPSGIYLGKVATLIGFKLFN